MERGEIALRLGASQPVPRGGAVVVEEGDAAAFMASFAAAVSSGGHVFLANPAWRSQERAEL